jgi:hypothetical protein
MLDMQDPDYIEYVDDDCPLPELIINNPKK